MKKLCLIVLLCLAAITAHADICVYNTADIAENAVKLLQNAKEVIHYCPTCQGDNKARKIAPASVKAIADDKIQERLIYINGLETDIAYIYIPTDKAEIYRNLGYIVQCADFSRTEVKEYLDAEHPYGIEAVNALRQKLEQCGDFVPYRSELKDDDGNIKAIHVAERAYADGYERCVYEIIDTAATQFYPDKAAEVTEAFVRMADETKKYYSYLNPEYQLREYTVKFKTNVLLEHAADTLLNEAAAKYGENREP